MGIYFSFSFLYVLDLEIWVYLFIIYIRIFRISVEFIFGDENVLFVGKENYEEILFFKRE